MDIKDDFISYEKAAGIQKVNIENIKESIKIIEGSNIDYEFRTTVVKEIHDYNHLEKICEYISPNAKYYIQNYQECDSVLNKGLTSFGEDEIKGIVERLKVTYPNVMIRGI